MFILTDRQYGEGFVINEYKGKISLIAARENEKSGKVYQKWGEIETGKDKTTRLPVSVSLGSPDEAVKTLQATINAVQQGLYKSDEDMTSWTPTPNNDDDIPF